MSKAGQLRMCDIRDAYRLIGDCRDLGSDSVLWQGRMLEGLVRLIGARAASTGEGRWRRPAEAPAPASAFSVGFTPPAWNGYLLTVASPCGVVFGRWVTPEVAGVGTAPSGIVELSLRGLNTARAPRIPSTPVGSRVHNLGFLRCLRHEGAKKWPKGFAAALRALDLPLSCSRMDKVNVTSRSHLSQGYS
jgi:hypothetical protein